MRLVQDSNYDSLCWTTQSLIAMSVRCSWHLTWGHRINREHSVSSHFLYEPGMLVPLGEIKVMSIFWLHGTLFQMSFFMFTYLFIELVWSSNPMKITFTAPIFHLFSYFFCTSWWTSGIITQTFIFSTTMNTCSKRHVLSTHSCYKREHKFVNSWYQIPIL